MAGYETTAHTLSFTIHSIASNKEVQQNIVLELQRNGNLDQAGNALRSVEYADLPALTYLGAVMKESMRTLPVVAAFPRFVQLQPQSLPCVPSIPERKIVLIA